VSFLLLGAVLALAVFGVVASLGALLAVLPARRLARGSGAPAGTLLLVRCAPTLLSAVVTAGVVVPAYVAYEPRTAEAPGAPLVGLGCLGAALLVLGACRCALALHATRSLRAHWRDAETVAVPECPLPAAVAAHPFPLVAVVGVRSPRLLVARGVLEALTPAELAAAARHEMAHVAAGDNLKALLLRSLPDPLGLLPDGRRLEAAWRSAVEEEADTALGTPGSRPSLDLAAALVKVARLAPSQATAPLATPALHDGGPLARRIRALAGAEGALPSGRRTAVLGTVLLLAPALALASPAVLLDVHGLIEHVVRALR
jgi:Zn-dependent protease with chaperone function